jgi:hypothetical protein
MNREDIKKLIQEAFIDNVYGKYPYSHASGEEDEAPEDYEEEWKRFSLDVVRDLSKSKAVQVAKVLIRDLELFEDVLDLAGSNQSIGSEILRKVAEAEKTTEEPV